MKRIKKVLAVGIMMVCCMFQAVAQNTAALPAMPVWKPIGGPAPALAIAKWMKGENIPEFKKGRVYVIEFWATWCKPCIAAMPHLSELARKYRKDATFIGLSVMEKAPTVLADVEKFVVGMGNKMDYTIAAEEGKLMRDNWLTAYAENSIPKTFIIDAKGNVAWIGFPQKLEQVLPLVLAGKWDTGKAAADRLESQKLTYLDGYEMVARLNPFMGNPGRPKEGLEEIAKLLAVYPGLKYYPKVGHFTFWNLAKTDPLKALGFGKEWINANDWPSYSTITDVASLPGLPSELYVFGADAWQSQLDRYPYSMDFPATYKKMAALYTKAGDDKKATECLKKAETYVPEGK